MAKKRQTMNFLMNLLPGAIWTRLIVYTLILASALAGMWGAYNKIDQGGFNRAMTEQAVLQAKQQKTNQENARFIETKYIQKQVVVNQVIAKIEKELPSATKNLTGCVLGDDAVKLLNDAAITVTN
jgi:hypothetical protein